MRAFLLHDKIFLNSSKLYRAYPYKGDLLQSEIFRYVLEEPMENKSLFKNIEQIYGKDSKITFIDENQIAKWPYAPMRLGRLSSKFIADDLLHLHAENEILSDQLRFLKKLKPSKKHFRFALFNGYGGGLGDNCYGSAAYRVVAEYMHQAFDSLSVDVLLGVEHRKEIIDIVQYDPFIERIRYKSLNLAEFTQYDGYFDTSGIPFSPKFNELPHVDWALWWSGLDPTKIDKSKKRNKFWIKRQTWNDIYNLLDSLPNIKAKTKLLFAPLSSTPLRTIPKEEIKKLTTEWLNYDSNIAILTQCNTDVDNQRVYNLEKKIEDTEHFAALIAQSDMCVSVDSFAPYVADASSVPCVILTSAIPASFFPYYPYGACIELPNMKNLECYGDSKIDDENKWSKLKPAYELAWSKLDSHNVLDALRKLMKVEKDGRPNLTIVTNEFHRIESFISESTKYSSLKRQRLTNEFKKAQSILSNIVDEIIPKGGTCIITGAATCDLCVQIAIHLQVLDGKLYVFEPRKILAQLCAGTLAHAACVNTNIFHVMPISGYKDVEFPSLDPWSESFADEWGNSLFETTKVDAQPIDEFNLDQCHTIIFQPPFPLLKVLQGALKTIKKYRPIVVAAPISETDIDIFFRIQKLDYAIQRVKLSESKEFVVGMPKARFHQLETFEIFSE